MNVLPQSLHARLVALVGAALFAAAGCSDSQRHVVDSEHIDAGGDTGPGATDAQVDAGAFDPPDADSLDCTPVHCLADDDDCTLSGSWEFVAKTDELPPASVTRAFATPAGSAYGGIVASWDTAMGEDGGPVRFWFVHNTNASLLEGGGYTEPPASPITRAGSGEEQLLVDIEPFETATEHGSHYFVALDNGDGTCASLRANLGVVEAMQATWPVSSIPLIELVGDELEGYGAEAGCEFQSVLLTGQEDPDRLNVFATLALPDAPRSAIVQASLARHSFEVLWAGVLGQFEMPGEAPASLTTLRSGEDGTLGAVMTASGQVSMLFYHDAGVSRLPDWVSYPLGASTRGRLRQDPRTFVLSDAPARTLFFARNDAGEVDAVAIENSTSVRGERLPQPAGDRHAVARAGEGDLLQFIWTEEFYAPGSGGQATSFTRQFVGPEWADAGSGLSLAIGNVNPPWDYHGSYDIVFDEGGKASVYFERLEDAPDGSITEAVFVVGLGAVCPE